MQADRTGSLIDRPPAGAPLRALVSLVTFWFLFRLVTHALTASVEAHPDETARVRPISLPTAAQQKWRHVGGGAAPAPRLVLSSLKNPAPPAPPFAIATIKEVGGSKPKRRWIETAFDLGEADRANAGQGIASSASGYPTVSSSRLSGLHQLASGHRISGYFWLFSRASTGASPDRIAGPASPPFAGQYGGSQAGLILSYQLTDWQGGPVEIYGRAAAPLSPIAEPDLAAGVRLRPVQGLPVAVHAEKRIAIGASTNSGVALFAAGGTGPERLLGSFRLEAYGQAGYVLGEQDTHFFDGSVVVDRPLLVRRDRVLAIAAGAWTGGQQGAARLDVGPRLDMRLPIAGQAMRISADWRIRIAGDAAPASGPAITLSSGF